MLPNHRWVQETSIEISYPMVIVDATLVAYPTPNIPTLKLILTIFTPKIKLPRLLSGKMQGSSAFASCQNWLRLLRVTLIYGCKAPVLTDQKQSMDLIQQLESPESNIMSSFWELLACEWLKLSLNNIMNTGGTRAHITHCNQGAILADEMGLGKTLNFPSPQ
ncbi:hypothetical protein VP01_3462g1 [Puccinia sorghi]|uniref:SNF2 N-terminal domain-containing protein n=1 Tax=Puccinia sorghi TaxID=27349 RepID=A0A0L6UW36_9BASI|nr:hypothetical protein VP01_3462g1 [Puccinia sorghi]